MLTVKSQTYPAGLFVQPVWPGLVEARTTWLTLKGGGVGVGVGVGVAVGVGVGADAGRDVGVGEGEGVAATGDGVPGTPTGALFLGCV